MVKKINRKKLLKEPDEFLTWSRKTFNYLVSHINQVIIVITGIMLIALMGVGIRAWNQNSENKAMVLLNQAMTQYKEAVNKDQQALEEAFPTIQESFETLIEDYLNTSAGRAGLIAYAQVNYVMKRFDKAIELLKTCDKKLDKQSSLKPIIQDGLAYAYIGKNEYDKAIDCLNKIIASQSRIKIDDILFQLGVIYEKKQNFEKSVEMYQQLINDYPDSIYIKIATNKVSLKDVTL